VRNRYDNANQLLPQGALEGSINLITLIDSQRTQLKTEDSLVQARYGEAGTGNRDIDGATGRPGNGGRRSAAKSAEASS